MKVRRTWRACPLVVAVISASLTLHAQEEVLVTTRTIDHFALDGPTIYWAHPEAEFCELRSMIGRKEIGVPRLETVREGRDCFERMPRARGRQRARVLRDR